MLSCAPRFSFIEWVGLEPSLSRCSWQGDAAGREHAADSEASAGRTVRFAPGSAGGSEQRPTARLDRERPSSASAASSSSAHSHGSAYVREGKYAVASGASGSASKSADFGSKEGLRLGKRAGIRLGDVDGSNSTDFVGASSPSAGRTADEEAVLFKKLSSKERERQEASLFTAFAKMRRLKTAEGLSAKATDGLSRSIEALATSSAKPNSKPAKPALSQGSWRSALYSNRLAVRKTRSRSF